MLPPFKDFFRESAEFPITIKDTGGIDGPHYMTANGLPFDVDFFAEKEDGGIQHYCNIYIGLKKPDGSLSWQKLDTVWVRDPDLENAETLSHVKDSLTEVLKLHAQEAAEQDDENLNITQDQDEQENPVQGADSSSSNPTANGSTPAANTSPTSTSSPPAAPTNPNNSAVQPNNTALNDPSLKNGTTNIGGKDYDTVNNIPVQIQNQGGKLNAYLLLNNQWTLVSPGANDTLQVKSDLKNYFTKQAQRT